MDDRLRFAIENTRLIEVRCNGNMRVAEPHDYGVHKKVERLLAYQLRSTARSLQRRVTGWRLFDLSKIEDCVVLDATFRGSRGHSHRAHLAWEVLYARVA